MEGRREDAGVDRNYKSQNPNNKQITMKKIINSKKIKKNNPKYVWVIDDWNLRFICNLVLGIWDLKMQIEKCEITFEFRPTTDYWILFLPLIVKLSQKPRLTLMPKQHQRSRTRL